MIMRLKMRKTSDPIGAWEVKPDIMTDRRPTVKWTDRVIGKFHL